MSSDIKNKNVTKQNRIKNYGKVAPYFENFCKLLIHLAQNPVFDWDPAAGDDVGVMHLTTTLEFSESIQPITVSQETDISVWANATGCYITGWGRSKYCHFFQAFTKV